MAAPSIGRRFWGFLWSAPAGDHTLEAVLAGEVENLVAVDVRPERRYLHSPP